MHNQHKPSRKTEIVKLCHYVITSFHFNYRKDIVVVLLDRKGTDVCFSTAALFVLFVH